MIKMVLIDADPSAPTYARGGVKNDGVQLEDFSLDQQIFVASKSDCIVLEG